MSEQRGPAPQGRYLPALVAGGLVHSAGMTPRRDGRLVVTGRIGDGVDPGTATAAAGLAAGNALTACEIAAGGADRIDRPVRMTVWIACAGPHAGLSAIADGASDVLAERFGADRLPVRAAVGVAALPGDAPVEVELTLSLRP
ncbi:RidA family protein [Pseudonocardia kongjuensis]|uniref:RidA family protein n=1 Tax=Pseudonocardia kongjuensis TaxID=102227 RepID=A0ABN1Y1I3_9PSEU